MIGSPITVGGQKYTATCVSMGNPHCVVLCDTIDGLDLETIGPEFEHAEIFPERVNTEFVRIENRTNLRMRVWERGIGEMLFDVVALLLMIKQKLLFKNLKKK